MEIYFVFSSPRKKRRKPTLRSHTHWQVVQKADTDQNLPKSMPAPTHGGHDIAAKLIELYNGRQKRPVANKFKTE